MSSGTFVGGDASVLATLPARLDARYVRVVVQKWHGHPSARVDVLACKSEAAEAAAREAEEAT